MLYDPKWEQQIGTRTVSLASFIAWLETKNPSEKYEFSNCRGGCLMGQFMTACNTQWNNENYVDFCNRVFGDWKRAEVLCSTPRTFGAALERARALTTGER